MADERVTSGPPLTVAVIGAGAVGAVLGGRLATVGANVTFLARGATLAALREHGLRLESPDGIVRLEPGHAAASATEIGACDVVLVGVKAEQVPLIAPSLAPLIGESTVVVPLQNGVEASTQLADALGEAHVAEGFCRMLAEQVVPGHVRYGGPVPTVAFGPRGPKGGAASLGDHPRLTLERLGAAFRAAGVLVETPADLQAALWEKFLFVEPLGVVGAAARAPFGTLLNTPETRALLEQCGREIMALGRAAGVQIGDDALGRVWERYATLPATGTASMQRDLMSGRPSELDAQTGSIVRLGRLHGAPALAHEVLYAVLRPQELRARDAARASSPAATNA